MVGYMVNPSCIDEGFRPRNPFTSIGGICSKYRGSPGCFVVRLTFMVGTWHRGDWLKERFGSAQSMVGWYMEVPDLVSICIC